MELSLEELEAVVGGQNTTEVNTPLGSYKSNETDYARCLGAAKTYCESQPANRTSFLGFDTGASTAKSSACLKSTLPQMCGTPAK